jgi:hypothetical protein
MEPISLTGLRNNLFKVIDQVIQTGNPVILERKGHRLKIVMEGENSKLDDLEPHDCIVGNPDDLVHVKVSETPLAQVVDEGCVRPDAGRGCQGQRVRPDHGR